LTNLRRARASIEAVPEKRPKDRHAISSLSRGVAVLRVFGEASGPLSNQDLAAATGLPKSTVSRITRTLLNDTFLVQTPRSGLYELSPAVLRLARSYHNSTGVAEIAGPHMQELASAVRGTVAVAARDGLGLVYVAIARAVSRIQVAQEPGYRVPIIRTSIGLAYLEAVPDEERRTLIAALRRQTTRDWGVIERDIERAADEIRRDGFCVCVGTWRPDVSAAAAALALPDGTVISFNVGGPPFWLKPEKLYREIGPRLVGMVRNIKGEYERRGPGRR